MDTQVIYTCPGKGQANRKTTLHINWDTISRDQLIVLARARIFHRLQLDFIASKQFPDHVSVEATDFVRTDVEYVDTQAVSAKKEREQKGAMSEFEKILAALSSEERTALIGELT